MDRLLSSGGLRAVGAAVVVFASMLLAAPTPSAASSYTLAYSGTVTGLGGIGGGVFTALGVTVGDAVSGTLTIDPFKTSPDSTSSLLNEFDQTSTSFTFHVSHPAKVDLTYSDTGTGQVLTAGTPNIASGVRFSLSGAHSTLETTYETDPNGPPLASLTGLPTSAAGLIALFGGTSPQAFGSFILTGYGQISFSIAVASTPIPATLPLLVSALGGLGFMGWRRRAA